MRLVSKPISGSRKRCRTRAYGSAPIAAMLFTWKSPPPSTARWKISSARWSVDVGAAETAGTVLSLIRMASEEELKAEIERLRAENQSLKKPARGQMSLKVSEKGGLSVYGLGRFPVTLYKEQWTRLLAMADEIRNFIRDNDAALKKKE